MQLHTPRDIGDLIRARRLTMRLSQSALAARVGVSRLWIVQTERGNPGASLELILRTLTALEVTLATAELKPTDADNPPPIQGPNINAVLTAARSW